MRVRGRGRGRVRLRVRVGIRVRVRVGVGVQRDTSICRHALGQRLAAAFCTARHSSIRTRSHAAC